MPPDEPTEEERQQELSQDQETPFQPADPNPSTMGNTTDPSVQGTATDLPDDHPATDTNLQPEELYDEGVAGAAEAEDRSGQSAVTGYTPPADDRSSSSDDPSDNDATAAGEETL